ARQRGGGWGGGRARRGAARTRALAAQDFGLRNGPSIRLSSSMIRKETALHRPPTRLDPGSPAAPEGCGNPVTPPQARTRERHRRDDHGAECGHHGVATPWRPAVAPVA